MAPIVELAVMRKDQYLADVRLDRWRGRPFEGIELNYPHHTALRMHGREFTYDTCPEIEPAFVDAVCDVARAACDLIINKRHYRATTLQVSTEITDDQLTTVVMRYLTDRRIALPQFPPHDHPIPRHTLTAPDKEFSYEDYFNDYPAYP